MRKLQLILYCGGLFVKITAVDIFLHVIEKKQIIIIQL